MLIRWCFSDWPVSGVTLHYLDRATLNKCKCVSKHLHMNISWVKWAVRARPAPGVGLHVESAAFRGEKRLHCAALSGSAAAGWTDGSKCRISSRPQRSQIRFRFMTLFWSEQFSVWECESARLCLISGPFEEFKTLASTRGDTLVKTWRIFALIKMLYSPENKPTAWNIKLSKDKCHSHLCCILLFKGPVCWI